MSMLSKIPKGSDNCHQQESFSRLHSPPRRSDVSGKFLSGEQACYPNVEVVNSRAQKVFNISPAVNNNFAGLNCPYHAS